MDLELQKHEGELSKLAGHVLQGDEEAFINGIAALIGTVTTGSPLGVLQRFPRSITDKLPIY